MYVYAVFFLDLCHFGVQNSEGTNTKDIYSINYGIGDTRLIMKKEESVKSFGTPSSLILVALNVLVLL